MIPVSLVAACAALVHPISVSSSRISVDGAKVQVELRCQGATILGCLPIDLDGDRRLGVSELEAARGELEGYLLDGYKLRAELETGSEQVLKGKLESLQLIEGKLSAITPREVLVDVVLRFDAPSPPRAITVEFGLFRECDPLHRDHAQSVWNGAAPEERVLWVEDPTWRFPPARGGPGDPGNSGGALRAFIGLGIEHILTGYDHIAFLVALVVASRRLRSVVAVVTAFTLAHSITLALASLGIVSVPAIVVEPAIAASIAFVAIRNVLSTRPRTLWPEAFGFGLIHGLGFAGSIQATLASEPQKLAALFGFNLGVEIGQLATVSGIIVVLALLQLGLRQVRSQSKFSTIPACQPPAGNPESLRICSGSVLEPALAPRGLRLGASSVVGLLGIYWFVTRIVSI